MGFGRNGRQVAEVVVFAAVGDGFEVFLISTVGDADTGNLTLLSHIYCPLFFNDRIVGKLIPGDSAALFHKTDNPFCIRLRLRNLIQGLLYKFISIQF